MNLQKFKRKDSHAGSSKPSIGITLKRFTFNVAFVRQASFGSYSKVAVLLNPKERGIGFRFHNNKDDPESFQLTPRNRGGTSFEISATAVLKNNKWIKSIVEDALVPQKFKPEYIDDDTWLIRLCPAFEHRVSNASEISSDTKGVYRYLVDNKIVYIGRGVVKSRANTSEREDWNFETIEYSVIEDIEKQRHWETFFLDRFVEENGSLPFYNKISGRHAKTS